LAADLSGLTARATGPEGLFELRRLELARQIGAEAALVRIRQGAAAVTAHATHATAEAQDVIAAERDSTTTVIAVAKSTLLAVVLASAAVALVAALYVAGHVTANLRAISHAMMRLAGALIEGVADLVGFAVREGVDLVVDTAPTPLPVLVDAGQLESAILNLCLNSGQAIEGKGQITLSVRGEGDLAVIEVADTGSGMTPEVLAHAMEPFFTARVDGAGTGLGLAMVYGFIRQSDGDIAISSTPGKGTCVRLCLPLHTAHAASEDLGTVLLVEDDPTDRAAATAFLAPMARRLLVAGDADAARARLGAVDLLVTDLPLCGRIEGWRLAEHALTRWRDLRVVIVSGHLPHVNPLSSRFPGRVALLEKPMSAKTLATALGLLAANPELDDKSARS
jgi:CheY-like chemotaxis protein